MGLSLKMQSSAVPTSATPLTSVSPSLLSTQPDEPPHAITTRPLLHPLCPLGSAGVQGMVLSCPIKQGSFPGGFLEGC